MAENIINKDLRTHAEVFNDLYANAPSRTAYNVGVNADLANRVSQGLGSIPGIGPALSAVADVAMPAGAFALSPAYDTLQGISRAGSTYSNQGPYAGIVDDTQVPAGPTLGQIGQAIANEKIGQTMFERMVGASAPLANRISNFNAPSIMGRAQAAEVTPQNEPMDIEDFLGTSTPQDLGFIGNAPSIQEAVAPVGITDRGRGMPGAPTGAFEMIGGTPVAVGDVLGMQQALEKADFVEETPQGLASFFDNPLVGLGMRLSPIGPLQDLGKLMGVRNAYNSFRSGSLGNAVNTAKSGLGSLGSRFAGTMRGINPATGRPNTQAQYEANRSARQTQNRIDNMLDRKAKGKSYSEKNLSDLIGKQIASRADKSGKGKKGGFTNPGKNSYGPHKGSDNSGSSGGSSKIVCTMMNERYGFGSFRNKIWMKFHEHHGPEYQKGYHAIFLPLVKIAKGEGKINTAVRKVLEHMGRHVTADMFKIMKGKKRDTLGRIYRAIFEPACHIIGKIKSALGRG